MIADWAKRIKAIGPKMLEHGVYGTISEGFRVWQYYH